MSIRKIISEAKISAADKKAVATAAAEYARISAVAEGASRPRDGAPSVPLHLAVDRAWQALCANPTDETREAYHAASMRRDQAKLTDEDIQSACHAPLVATSATLKPVALRILDDAEAAAKAAAASQREAMLAAGVDSKLVSQHDAALVETLRAIEGERATAEHHALDWCQRHGLAE